jgi:hypothetical protein
MVQAQVEDEYTPDQKSGCRTCHQPKGGPGEGLNKSCWYCAHERSRDDNE